jgi:hypothetical protein
LFSSFSFDFRILAFLICFSFHSFSIIFHITHSPHLPSHTSPIIHSFFLSFYSLSLPLIPYISSLLFFFPFLFFNFFPSSSLHHLSLFSHLLLR